MALQASPGNDCKGDEKATFRIKFDVIAKDCTSLNDQEIENALNGIVRAKKLKQKKGCTPHIIQPPIKIFMTLNPPVLGQKRNMQFLMLLFLGRQSHVLNFHPSILQSQRG